MPRSAAENKAAEKARLQVGLMYGMERLIIFTWPQPVDEPSPWYLLETHELVDLPPDVDPTKKMTKKQRRTPRLLTWASDKGTSVSHVFCRVEKGKPLINCSKTFRFLLKKIIWKNPTKPV
jgi:hypothetical protein